jgi:uroporphyrin-III C-methyltransferase / precorrin-2 dehydrogenase / sirohydrochlorin ferrochelatase
VLAQAIRARLQAAIPYGFARWVEAASRWRARVQSSGLSSRGRRSFWQRFADLAVTQPSRSPEPSDCDRLLKEARTGQQGRNAGSVTLVGAGPGDPELLTLRAVRALQSADVILYDDLVSTEVLDFARRESRKMLVGKTGHGPSCRQNDINTLMVSLARSGKRVVRLKGGDPMIFGRADEEIAACRGAGLPVDVVPGVTAAQAAASRLQFSLTHRSKARRVQYITGHARGGGLPDDIDWRCLADPSVTTAVYMPVRTLAALADKAIAAGLNPSTPAVAIAGATRPHEAWLAAPIAELPGRMRESDLEGPVLVLIGSTLTDASDSENRRIDGEATRALASKEEEACTAVA